MHSSSVQFSSVTQLCPTLCYLVDCSQPGSSAHGILKARLLECVAMPSSRRSSQSWNLTCISSKSESHCLHWFRAVSSQILLPGPKVSLSVQFSHSILSSSLQPHESQHDRPPCPSPTPIRPSLKNKNTMLKRILIAKLDFIRTCGLYMNMTVIFLKI